MPSFRSLLSRFWTRIIASIALIIGLMLGTSLRQGPQHIGGGRMQRLQRDYDMEMSGAFYSDAEAPVWIGSPTKITPMIHQIWDDEIVEGSCQASAQSWEWFCDVYGCNFKLWRRQDLNRLTPFVNRDHYDTIESPQMRADIARLEILNKWGGLYLDCDMIWAGRSRASDEFVRMMFTSELAVASSNDIRNATGRDKSLDLAVVFFTNRVLAAAPNQPVIGRTIELAKERLDNHVRETQKALVRRAAGENIATPKIRAFHMTGPYILNKALQEAGESSPVAVIPTNWVYPEDLMNTEALVMFGHSKDRTVHASGISSQNTNWRGKPWLMHRSLPNFFTKAQDIESRISPEDYRVHPTVNFSHPTGAVAVFLHHNKAGGTAVKVAMAQMFNITENLTRADSFSKSACAYSKQAVKRTLERQTANPDFCEYPEWRDHNLPSCGRCRSPALTSMYTPDVVVPRSENATDIFDEAPNGWTGERGEKKCAEMKAMNKCQIPIMRGKCCKTCGRVSCPELKFEGPQETTPTGVSGDEATRKCLNFKKQGLCTDPRLRGFCCLTCGQQSCSAPNMVVGDYSIGICDVLPSDRPCAYYTMLREPRKRIASSYLHCQYEPDDQLCMSHILDAREATFEEWVAHQGNYLFRQLTFDLQSSMSIEEQYEMYLKFAEHQQRLKKLDENGAWIANEGETAPVAEQDRRKLVSQLLRFKPNMLWLMEQHRGFKLGARDVESVVQLLEYLFAVIGLVEHFDESLEMYEAVFGLPFPDAISHKSKSQTEHQLHVHEGEDLSLRKRRQASLVDEFKSNPKLDEYIAVDLALYAKAVELFEEQHVVLETMKREAVGLGGELSDFDSLGNSPKSWLQSVADETMTFLKRAGKLVMSDDITLGLEETWAKDLDPPGASQPNAATADTENEGYNSQNEVMPDRINEEETIDSEGMSTDSLTVVEDISESENLKTDTSTVHEYIDEEEALAAKLEAQAVDLGSNVVGRKKKNKRKI